MTMTQRKPGPIILLISTFIIIILSRMVWFVVESSLNSTNQEKRVLASKPSLTMENYSSYSAEYTSYFNDNLPFRNYLITLNSAIDYFIFGRSSTTQVIIGKEGWLFYARQDDGDPLACYKGINLYTTDELERIAQNCISQRDYLESEGKEFIILIAPNKERIYPEYMPDQYGVPAERYAALQVYEYLKKHTNLRIIYPYKDLLDAKANLSEPVYYKTDTHWNYIGGYIAACALLQEVGIDMPQVTDSSITISKSGVISGDLIGLLGLGDLSHFSDLEYLVEGYNLHSRIELENIFEERIYYHSTGSDPRRIYVIRDSFGSQIAPYIGSQFNDSCLRYRWSYSYDDYKEFNPDIVVFETVERYIDILESFSVHE